MCCLPLLGSKRGRLRARKRIKNGRHVGLDFCDLLIEAFTEVFWPPLSAPVGSRVTLLHCNWSRPGWADSSNGRVSDDSPELSSHAFTRGGFLGQPVLCPTLLPVGRDAALGLLAQHALARKLYLGINNALALSALTGGATPDHWFSLPRARLLGLTVGPWGEELGWRGYAQPQLQQGVVPFGQAWWSAQYGLYGTTGQF